MNPRRDLHSLRAIAQIRSLQKAGRETALGLALQTEQRKRTERTAAQDALDADQAMWLASLNGSALHIDACALWAGAVRTGVAIVDEADQVVSAASLQCHDARSAMKTAIAGHDAACALASQAGRAASRQRDEAALQAMEDLRLSRRSRR